MSTDHGAAHGGGDNTIWKAVGIGFLVLILANGNMPANTQFALIAGIIAYVVISRGKKSGGDHH